jgi:hypothetical protein
VYTAAKYEVIYLYHKHPDFSPARNANSQRKHEETLLFR